MPILLRNAALSLPDPLLASKFIVRLPMGDYMREVVCEAVQPTFLKTPANPRYNAGTNSYYPGISDIDGITMTLYENVDMTVTNWLHRWRLMVFDPTTGFYGLPAVYKKTINIGYLNNEDTEIYSADYLGCWPTDKAPFNLDYSADSERIRIELQLSVDDMRWR